LIDLDDDHRRGRIDERHDRRKGEIADPSAAPERNVRHVPVRRRTHHRFIEIPSGALELSFELIDFGLSLLNVEAAARIAFVQGGHLSEAGARQCELSFEGLHLSIVGSRVDPEKHVAALQGHVRRDRHVRDLPGDVGNDRDCIAIDQRLALGRAPAHRNEQPEIEQQQDDKGRRLPKGVQVDDAQPDQCDKQPDIEGHQRNHHGERSALRRPGMST
jgi:hypothetical protein